MAIDAPIIYPMDQAKLVEQIQKLALKYYPHEYFPEAWKDLSSIQSDKQADALIRIFARMMEILINRLNKVPDKNFLTFLDLIGVRLSPPTVARAPLVFTMTSGASQYDSIPAGTQIATEEANGQAAVVFETEKALTVILPKLVKAVSLSPADDKWTDHSNSLIGNIGEEIKLFKGKNSILHRLYLGHSKLFSFKEEMSIKLEIEISNEGIFTGSLELDKWEVKWYYSDEKSVPRLLEIKKTDPSDPSDPNMINWRVANLLKSGSITFKPVAGISEKVLSGVEEGKNQRNSWINIWIFADLSTPVPADNLPTISNVNAHVDIIPESSIIPDLAFFNNIPLDLSKDFYPFGERPKFNDTFYFGSNEVFSKKDTKIIVGVTLSKGMDAPVSENIKLLWEFWNGSFWETIGETAKSGVSIDNYNFTDGTKALTLKGENTTITFTCPNIEEKEINGEKNRWVRVRIIEGNYGDEARYEELPAFKGTGKIKIDAGNTVNGVETAFKREIEIGDFIIINTDSTNGRRVTSIVSDISLTVDPPFTNATPETEFYIKKVGWRYVPATYKPPSISRLTLEYNFSSQDRPEVILVYNNFTYENYTYYLFNWNQVPGNDSERLLNYLMQNFDASWIKDSKLNKSNNNTINISDGKNSLSLTLRNNQSNEKKVVSLVINGVERYKLTAKLENNNNNVYDETKETFAPFQPVDDKQSALYLAFDQNIAALPVTIFFPLIGRTIGTKKALIPSIGTGTISSNNKEIIGTGINFTNELRVGDSIAAVVQERTVTSISSDTSLIVDSSFNPALKEKKFTYTATQEAQDSPFLIWQYWAGNEWRKLKVEDNTNNLTKREMIQFLAPEDIVKRYLFDFESEYYWIRATLEKGRYEEFPNLKAIYTNTVWAHNMVTIKDEILGFSNGKPDQVFMLSQSPVLSGQKVLVRELSLSEEDRKTIISEEGEDSIKEITDDAGNVTGFWVRWHEMKNFYFSKPNSRHYTADLNNGTITFGDGNKGMMPPAGKDNIKCSYQAGGGVKGNVPAGTINKLRTTFPFIDSVTNPEAAAGGGNKEDLDRIRERGPKTLKHRDRAVTYEDFEELVKEAASNVAKVKCLPTRDPYLRLKPGWVTLIIVPVSDDPKPLPDQQLINEIETYLFERTSSYLTTYPSQINLIGPGYIQVGIEACVQFTSITEAKTIEGRILDNLQQFFHPLHGGPEKEGWDFGRNVYISEIYELIENTDGVDHVDDLTLKAAVQVYKLKLKVSLTLSVSYPKHSTVSFISDQKNPIILFLAETLPKSPVVIDELYVVGFKEGDQIKINDKKENYITTLLVKSVLDDVLECETDATIPIQDGSIVETPEGIRSYTTADSVQKPDQIESIRLTVATPDETIPGTKIVLTHRDNPTINESLDIDKITKEVDIIFINENYLVYSGTHSINKR
jgi:hypothetical protein